MTLQILASTISATALYLISLAAGDPGSPAGHGTTGKKYTESPVVSIAEMLEPSGDGCG